MVSDLPDGYSEANNPLQIYDYHLTVPVAAHDWAARVYNPAGTLVLPVGILRRVLLFFPPGLNNTVRAFIWQGVNQIIPVDPAGIGARYLTGDSYMWDMYDLFHPIVAGATQFYIIAHNTSGLGVDTVSSDHTIDIYFMVEVLPVP